MYAADISKANVMAMFLLTENLDRLMPKFLDAAAGLAHRHQRLRHHRLDARRDRQGRAATAAAGAPRICSTCRPRSAAPGSSANGQLAHQAELPEDHRHASTGGNSTPIEGSLDGEAITFTAGGATYTGRVDGNTMSGEIKGGAAGKWSATRK